MDHPHILKLYEYFEDEKNFYIITEMCKGGELFDKIVEKEFINDITEGQAREGAPMASLFVKLPSKSKIYT